MCFFHGSALNSMTRGDAIVRLAALGAMPYVPSSVSMPAPQQINMNRRYTAIVGSTAIVGPNLELLPESTILLRGATIERVGRSSDVTVPAGAYRIDAGGMFTIPGLIDSHVHFFQSGGLFARPDAIDLRTIRPYTDELQSIHDTLDDTFARYLRAGITSVVDVGGPFLNYDVRARANRTTAAPRVMVAGPLISSVERDILNPNGDPPIVKIETVEAARALIDRQVAARTDFIKLWWVVPDDKPAAAFRPVATAAVAYAHERGIRVIIHATELETARLAVDAGTDILAHSVFDADVDDAFVALLVSRKVTYCPTLNVLNNYIYTFRSTPNLSAVDLHIANPDVVGTLLSMSDVVQTFSAARKARVQALPAPQPPLAAMRNLKRIHDAGVTVAASTDAGNIGTLHASSLYDEALQMVASGLSPKEVLRTATVGGAAMMGRLHDLGTIQDGKLADLVVLERNPLEDIGAIASAKFVVKDGHVFDSATILREPPAQIVQRLVNAYNVHDPAIIAEVLAADASFAAAGISPLRSRADIASYHRDLFAQNPALHIEVLGRQTDADTVTDRAIVSGWSDGRQTAESTLMYRVRDREVTSVAVT